MGEGTGEKDKRIKGKRQKAKEESELVDLSTYKVSVGELYGE
jgi:hypothetical protein